MGEGVREPKGAELKAEGCKYHLSETVVHQ